MNELPDNNWLKILPANKEKSISWKLFPLCLDELYTASVVSSMYQKHLLGYKANNIKSFSLIN